MRAITLCRWATVCVVSLSGLNAFAWEPICRLVPDDDFLELAFNGRFEALRQYPKCQTDADLAAGHWVGEHFELCARALASEHFSSEADFRIMIYFFINPLYLGESNNARGYKWKPGTFAKQVITAADLVPMGVRHLCEFSEIADSTQHLIDWSKGHLSSDCPQQKSPCRDFPTLGPLNSNHFGAQAAATYLLLHNKALQIMDLQKAQGEKQIAAARSYPTCLASGQAYGCTNGLDLTVDDGLRSVALAYEGLALHYLQDSWSVGHMWNRWGSPVASKFASPGQAGAIALMTGIIHGSKAILKSDDAMCSPKSSPARWGFEGQLTRFNGAGDLHLQDVLEDPKFSVQREWMIACVALSIGEVVPSLQNEHFAGLSARYELAKCLNHFVTNDSLASGFSLSVPGTVPLPDPVPVPGLFLSPNTIEVAAPQVTEFARTSVGLLGRFGNFDLSVLTKIFV